MSDAPLTDDDLRALAGMYSHDIRVQWLIRNLLAARSALATLTIGLVAAENDRDQARADLAAETATRTALRTQEARVSGLLADARTVPCDLIDGVAALIAERDEARATVARSHEAVAAFIASNDRIAAERDEMRAARDVLLAEVDRLRAIVGRVEHRWEGECPEDDTDASRDPKCIACQAMGPAAGKAGKP